MYKGITYYFEENVDGDKSIKDIYIFVQLNFKQCNFPFRMSIFWNKKEQR